MIEDEFSPDPESATKVRRFISRHLSGSPLIDDIMLVTSELVTNSIVHAKTPFKVAIVQDDVLRVEVSDRSTAMPTIGESTNGHGYGLAIVDSLSTRWGVAVTPTGKTVWVELQHPGTEVNV
jgi:anti-sigma regulatory factor (Ser/Thr protein kinase)